MRLAELENERSHGTAGKPETKKADDERNGNEGEEAPEQPLQWCADGFAQALVDKQYHERCEREPTDPQDGRIRATPGFARPSVRDHQNANRNQRQQCSGGLFKRLQCLCDSGVRKDIDRIRRAVVALEARLEEKPHEVQNDDVEISKRDHGLSRARFEVARGKRQQEVAADHDIERTEGPAGCVYRRDVNSEQAERQQPGEGDRHEQWSRSILGVLPPGDQPADVKRQADDEEECHVRRRSLTRDAIQNDGPGKAARKSEAQGPQDEPKPSLAVSADRVGHHRNDRSSRTEKHESCPYLQVREAVLLRGDCCREIPSSELPTSRVD